MSSHKKHKSKKLSEQEQFKRAEARRKRKERQKLEHIRANREFAVGLPLFIVGIILYFWLMIFHINSFLIYFSILAVLFVTLCDKSGIRSFLFRHYPDSFPWADTLKAEYPERSLSMESASTISGYLFILLIGVQKLSVLWSIFYIICIGIGFYHVVFRHHEYQFDRTSSKSNTDSTLFLISPILLGMFLDFRNVRWTKFLIIFVISGFILMMILALIHSDTEIGHAFITATLFGFFLYTGFCMINQHFDFSEPVNYACTVENKTYHSGKTSSHDIDVTDWKNPDDTIDIQISKNQYDALEIGDTVTVSVYQGALHMEHYQLKN